MSWGLSISISQLGDEERRNRLYAGDIFIMSATERTRTLIDFARQMLEEAFAPHDPRTIHEHKTPEEVAAILGKLKPLFIHHPFCKKIVPQIMEEHGVDIEKLYFDVPRMRSAYPSHFLTSGIAYAFHPHRDTWYSAPMCQLNWWLPIYPIEPDNSMGFYPRYFSEAISNSSQGYNYYEWNANNRASAAQHVKTDTRVQPKAREPIEPVTMRFLPPPGGIIVFSGAQLHRVRSPTRPTWHATASTSAPCITTTSSRAGAPRTSTRAAAGRASGISCAPRISLPFPRRRWHCTMTTPPRVTGCSTSATSS